MDLENPMGSCNLEKGNCYNLCIFDSLTISDRAKSESRSLCGEIPPQSEIVSKSNFIDITFTSDLSTAGRGFKISYNTLTSSELAVSQTCPEGEVWKRCRRICKLGCDSYSNNVNTTDDDFVPCSRQDGTVDFIQKTNFHDVVCNPGCECPDTRPIRKDGKCIVVEECQNSTYECGHSMSTRSKKIVGGETAMDGSWPWMVQLTTNDLVTDCGATLICSKSLLTRVYGECLRKFPGICTGFMLESTGKRNNLTEDMYRYVKVFQSKTSDHSSQLRFRPRSQRYRLSRAEWVHQKHGGNQTGLHT